MKHKNIKRLATLAAATLLNLSSIQTSSANTNIYSELSHTAGGALMAGAITYVVQSRQDRAPQDPHHSAWVGFGISSAAALASQYYEYSTGSNTAREAIADALAHVIGSAIGAYLTDSYLLEPVLQRDAGNHYNLGLELYIPL